MARKNRKPRYPQNPEVCHQESQAIEHHLIQLGVPPDHHRAGGCTTQCFLSAEFAETEQRRRTRARAGNASTR